MNSKKNFRLLPVVIMVILIPIILLFFNDGLKPITIFVLIIALFSDIIRLIDEFRDENIKKEH